MNYWMILKKDLIGKIYGFIGIKFWKVRSSFFMFFLVIIELAPAMGCFFLISLIKRKPLEIFFTMICENLSS